MQQNDKVIADLTDTIDKVKNEIDSNVQAIVDTSVFEDDVDQAEQNLAECRNGVVALRDQLEKSKPEIDERRGRVQEITFRIEKVMDDLRQAEVAMTQYLDTQSQCIDDLEKKRRKVAQFVEAMEKHAMNIAEIQETRDKSLLSARKLTYRFHVRKNLGQDVDNSLTQSTASSASDPTTEELEAIDPVEVEKAEEYYMARILKTREKIKSERQRREMSNEDPAVAYEKYARAKTDLDSKMKQIEEIETKVTEMELDLQARRRRWRQFRKHLEQTTCVKFNEMLSLNKYNGDLEFNHESGTLDLIVNKDGANSETQTKDVKALRYVFRTECSVYSKLFFSPSISFSLSSGGERSYTTMCLLLALGENLETPFRILDEFDVFLDAQVRKLTISALIHVAKKMEHRQFIFITPQDVSNLRADPQLRIHKLNPPARYNTAGGATQQTLTFTQEA
jgi:structural maintenance of chromosomes protein 6